MQASDLAALNNQVLWAAFFLSVVFGAIAQRTHFCTMGAISDVMNMGDWTRLRQWVLAIGVAMLGFAVLVFTGQVDPAKTLYASSRFIWLSAAVGGALFGFGMVLASGCGSKTLVRIGGGSLKSLVVFLVMGVAAFATLKGITAVVRVGTVDRVAVDMASGTSLAGWLAAATGLALKQAWLVLGGLLGGALVLWALLGRGFRTFDNLLAGLGIGGVVVAMWWVSGHLGYVAEHNVPFLMEVADRTEADRKGGHIAQRLDGQLILREVAQCPEADLPAFQDIKRHAYFNTNSIWVNLRQLKALLDANNNVIKLPMIRNAKTVDPKDSRSPAVFQLETAMGAAIAIFPGARVLRVGRDRFMPVKTCDDLLRLRSDIYTLDEGFRLVQANDIAPTIVALDSRFYKLIDGFEARFAAGAPSLRACERLNVEGDVTFGAGVVCQGTVHVRNPADAQGHIPDGTTLRGEHKISAS